MESEIPISSSELEVKKNGNGVEAFRQLYNETADVLHFYAPDKDLRTERTGIHGRLEIYLNNSLIGYDNFNFEKENQRNTFAGHIFKSRQAQALSPVYDRESLQTDLTTFTFDAYDVKITHGIQSDLVYGDPTQELSEFIKKYVVKGGGTIINALPKQGKSYISMAMAVSVDAGLSRLWDVQQGNALYINLERSASSMIRRLGGVNTALGLDYERPLRFMNVRGRSLLEIIENVKRQIETHDIQLIVVDSISRAGMGSLIEDRPAMKITDELNGLVEETDKSWIGIAHRAWSNEHVFGSVHFLAACDVMIDLEKSYNTTTREMGVKLTVSGENDLGPSSPEIIGVQFDAMGVTAMRKATIEDFPDLDDKEADLKDQIIGWLRNKPPQEIKNIASALDKPYGTIRTTIKRHQYEKNSKPKGIFIELQGKFANRTYQFEEV